MGAGEANDAPLAAVGGFHQLLHLLRLLEIQAVVGTLGLDPDSEGASRIQIHHPLLPIPDFGHLALHGALGHEAPSRPSRPVVMADQAEGGGGRRLQGVVAAVCVGRNDQAPRGVLQLQAVPGAHRERGPVAVGGGNDGVCEVGGGAPGPAVVPAGDLAQPCHVDPALQLVTLRHLPGDGDEEEENGARGLVIQGAWVHGPATLQLGFGHRLLRVPLRERRGGEA